MARFDSNGDSLGEVLPFGNQPAAADAVALAAGGGSTLAVYCGCCGRSCDTRIITGTSVVEGDTLPGSQFVTAGYSDATWLVATWTGTGFSVSQLGADGSLIENTTHAAASSGLPGIIAEQNGFALAWPNGAKLELAHVDFDGTFTPMPQTLTAPSGSFGEIQLRRFGGENYLFAEYDNGAGWLMQRLDASFAPVGESVTDFPKVAAYAVASKASVFGLTASPYYDSGKLEGALVHFGPSVTADPLQLVGVAPTTQRNLLGAPAPDGWLVVWKEYGSSGPNAQLTAARLKADGAPSGAAFDLGPADSYVPTSLSRGPNGWFLSLYDSSFPASNRLYLLADDSTSLSSVEGPSGRSFTSNGPATVVGSAAGWARLISTGSGAEKSLALERYNAQAELVEWTPLAQGEAVPDTTGIGLRNGKYFVWWARSQSPAGQVMFVNIPTSGPIPDKLVPKLLFDPHTPAVSLATSNNSFWGLTSDALYEARATHLFDKPNTFSGDLLGFDGAALKVSRRVTKCP